MRKRMTLFTRSRMTRTLLPTLFSFPSFNDARCWRILSLNWKMGNPNVFQEVRRDLREIELSYTPLKVAEIHLRPSSCACSDN